jgi:hypothetical protein
LVDGIAERFRREVAALRDLTHAARPIEEARHQRSHVLLAKGLALRRRCAAHGLIDRVDGANPHQPLQPDRIPADRRLEEVASQHVDFGR